MRRVEAMPCRPTPDPGGSAVTADLPDRRPRPDGRWRRTSSSRAPRAPALLLVGFLGWGGRGRLHRLRHPAGDANFPSPPASSFVGGADLARRLMGAALFGYLLRLAVLFRAVSSSRTPCGGSTCGRSASRSSSPTSACSPGRPGGVGLAWPSRPVAQDPEDDVDLRPRVPADQPPRRVDRIAAATRCSRINKVVLLSISP